MANPGNLVPDKETSLGSTNIPDVTLEDTTGAAVGTSGNPLDISVVSGALVSQPDTTDAVAGASINEQAEGGLNSAGTVDRLRDNVSVTVLASGSRTTTQTSADIPTYNASFLQAILDMTVVTAGPSVTLTINGKDDADGTYYPLLVGAAVTTAVENVYQVGPGLPATTNVSANKPLPDIVQLVVTANNANAGTYSLDLILSE